VPDYQNELANSHLNFGKFLADGNRKDEAEVSFRHLLEILEKLAVENPKLPDYQQGMASGLDNLSILLFERGQKQEAKSNSERALEIRKKLAAGFTAIPDYQHNLAFSYYNLGVSASQNGRLKEAETFFRSAVAIERKLVQDFPALPRCRSELGFCLHSLGNSLYEQARWQESRDVFKEAILEQKSARLADPNNPTYLKYLRNHLFELSRSCLRMGDHPAALHHALELPKLGTGDMDDFLQAASLAARCIPLAEQDPSFSKQQRSETVEAYAIQTVGLLRQAIAGGSVDNKLLENTEFMRLKDRPDFQMLIPKDTISP
jgi:tetratricopeptide (TPR) repeat protein